MAVVDNASMTRVLNGRYETHGLIGAGGMGEVYAGVDRRLHRDVAVKILRPAMATNDAVRRRFEAEARIAARLVHPNVVAVFDSGEEPDGTPYLVMERLPGDTLADAIAAGPLPVEAVTSLGAEILAGVGAAHAAGLLHRDVKPGNILATGTGHWKVGDFGIAKGGPADETTTLSTTVGQIYGTLPYLAPERVAGGPATISTDLYAVGVVLYEALAGRRPVPNDAPPAAYLAPQPEPVAALRPDVPPALAAAVMRAIDPDPARRYTSAADFAGALESPTGAPAAALAPTAVLAAPPLPSSAATMAIPTAVSPMPLAPMPPAPPLRRTRRSFLIVVAALLLALAALLAIERWTSGPARSTTSTTVPTTVPPTTTTVTTVPTTLPTTVPPKKPGRHHDGGGGGGPAGGGDGGGDGGGQGGG